MKKLISLFLCLCLFCGCAAKEQTMEQDGFTFTDDLDRSITIEEPQRVACLLGSFAQIWQLAGGEVGATADDAWDDMQLELAEDTVNLGNTKQLSLELLLDFQPDFEAAVIRKFAASYEAGLTPNPCIDCNPTIKFRILMEEADRLGCKYIATGHYVRTVRDGENVFIKQGSDNKKDQS